MGAGQKEEVREDRLSKRELGTVQNLESHKISLNKYINPCQKHAVLSTYSQIKHRLPLKDKMESNIGRQIQLAFFSPSKSPCPPRSCSQRLQRSGTNLCGRRLLIEVKVSLFTVRLVCSTDKPSNWQAGNEKRTHLVNTRTYLALSKDFRITDVEYGNALGKRVRRFISD